MRLEETANIQTIHANLVRVIERKNLRYINWLRSTRIEKGSRAISTSILSYRELTAEKKNTELGRVWTRAQGGGGGGGYTGFQVTGMIEWSQKVKTQKIPRASNKTQKNPWTKN